MPLSVLVLTLGKSCPCLRQGCLRALGPGLHRKTGHGLLPNTLAAWCGPVAEPEGQLRGQKGQ